MSQEEEQAERQSWSPVRVIDRFTSWRELGSVTVHKGAGEKAESGISLSLVMRVTKIMIVAGMRNMTIWQRT